MRILVVVVGAVRGRGMIVMMDRVAVEFGVLLLRFLC